MKLWHALCLLGLLLLGMSDAKRNRKKGTKIEWRSTSMPKSNRRFESKDAGQNLKLDCKAKSQSRVRVDWIKDGIRINTKKNPKIKTRKSGQMFILTNLTAADSGNYTCLASNKHGESLEWTFTVEVKADMWPLQVEGPKNMTVMEGEELVFTCTVQNDSQATINWQKLTYDANTMKQKWAFQKQSLYKPDPSRFRIASVKKEDEGTYRCMAANLHRLKYSPANLTVTERKVEPSRPTDSSRRITNIYDNNNDNNGNSGGNFFPYDNDNKKNKNDDDNDLYPPFGTDFNRNDPNYVYNQDDFTTTRRPRKNGRRKNGRKKNKNKKNKNKKNRKKTPKPRISYTEPPMPSTTYTYPSTYRSSESSTHFMVDRDRTTKIWNFNKNKKKNSESEYVPDSRSNPDIYNPNVDDDDDDDAERKPDESGASKEGNLGSAKSNTNRDTDKGGDISAWKIYTIVGAVGGVILLIGLVAITIAVCCPRQEGGVYKSTPV